MASKKSRTEVGVRVAGAAKGQRSAAARRNGSGRSAGGHRTYTIVIHPAGRGETGYWVEVPALPGCNTQGETYEEAVSMAKKAIEGYIQMLRKLGEPVPVQKQPKRTTTAAVKVLA